MIYKYFFYVITRTILQYLSNYVLSRKNFLFCGSEDDARSTCLLFSIIECAIMNDINFEEYLSSRFELAADATDWTDSK